MTDYTTELGLEVGRRYRFNFPQSPANVGIYFGRAAFSNDWIVMRSNEDGQEQTRFYNLRMLSTITPLEKAS